MDLKTRFFYQPTLDTLELRKDKDTDYVLSWDQKGVYKSKLMKLYTASLLSITCSGNRMGIKLDKSPLAAEQNNYSSKIVNVYIVYDLDATCWPRNPNYISKFKNFLFEATI